MKSCSILSLFSQCMMQNIHKWGKAMRISDTATSDYSTHMELEASSLIVLTHLEDKQSNCDYEKTQITKKDELHSELLFFPLTFLVCHW